MEPDPPWLAQAAALPIAFALVREDPLLDRDVLAPLVPKAQVIMVASGGCTAAVLAVANAGRLHLVDPNPAQLALCRLKLHLLQTTRPAQRLALLGHSPLDVESRRKALAEAVDTLGLDEDCLGPPDFVGEVGPDNAGRYERLFARLRQALADHDHDLDALLSLRDPVEQSRRAAPDTDLGRALDAAYDDVLALPNLVRLFGEGATQNPVEPFARHFARRTRATLATLPAADNPYLWHMLRGRFPDGATLPWLTLPHIREQLPPVTCTRGFMADVLGGEREKAYDFVHLSNILDWLTPQEAVHTLRVAWQALRPGGRVFIRQLNSTLDIAALGEFFRWHTEEAQALHRRDRSFFYRTLHLGTRVL
jgi:S-adenosylmethionine-diacylglycerol 3-amino-3-carboxypropyl transferase